MSTTTIKPTAAITPRHYQAMCGLSLSAVVLIQLQQSSLATHVALLVGVLILFLGMRGILYKARLSPMLLLLALAVPYVVEQFSVNEETNPDLRGVRFLDIADVLVAMAALTYFVGHYRLHGLWFGVLPADPRTDLLASPSGRKKGAAGVETPAPPRVRSEESLSAPELAVLVFTVPAFALLAEFAFLLMKQPWRGMELPPRVIQLILIAWKVVLTLFLTAHAFRYWRRLQMDRVSALLMLQDILWSETRGEQRRINRWIAWKKLREKK